MKNIFVGIGLLIALLFVGCTDLPSTGCINDGFCTLNEQAIGTCNDCAAAFSTNNESLNITAELYLISGKIDFILEAYRINYTDSNFQTINALYKNSQEFRSMSALLLSYYKTAGWSNELFNQLTPRLRSAVQNLTGNVSWLADRNKNDASLTAAVVDPMRLVTFKVLDLMSRSEALSKRSFTSAPPQKMVAGAVTKKALVNAKDYEISANFTSFYAGVNGTINYVTLKINTQTFINPPYSQLVIVDGTMFIVGETRIIGTTTKQAEIDLIPVTAYPWTYR